MESTGSRLFAEAAENALRQIDIVTRGAARAIFALIEFNRDRHRWAKPLRTIYRRCNALPIWITTQCMKPRKRGDCGVFSSGNCTVILCKTYNARQG